MSRESGNGSDKTGKMDERSLEQFKVLLKDPAHCHSEMQVTETHVRDMQNRVQSCSICADVLFGGAAAPFAYIRCPKSPAHTFHLGCFVGPSGFLEACPVCGHGCRSKTVRFYVKFVLLYTCQCMGSVDQQTVRKVFACWKKSVSPASFSKELASYRFTASELEILRHYCSTVRPRFPCHGRLTADASLRLRESETDYPVLHRLLDAGKLGAVSSEMPVCVFSNGFIMSLSTAQILALIEATLRNRAMNPLLRVNRARTVLSYVKHSRDVNFCESEMCALLGIIIKTDSCVLLVWLYHRFSCAVKFRYSSIVDIIGLYVQEKQEIDEDELAKLYIFMTSGSRLMPEQEETIAGLLTPKNTPPTGGTRCGIRECHEKKTGEFFDKMREFRETMDRKKSNVYAGADAAQRIRFMMTSISIPEFRKIRFLFPQYRIWASAGIFQLFPADSVAISHCIEILEHGARDRNYNQVYQVLQVLTYKTHYTHATFMHAFDVLRNSPCYQAIYFLFTLTGRSVFRRLQIRGHTGKILAEVVRLALFICIPYLEEYAENTNIYNEAVALYKMQILTYDMGKLRGFVCDDSFDHCLSLPFYYRNFDLFLAKSSVFAGYWRDEIWPALLDYFIDERFSAHVEQGAVGGIFRFLSQRRATAFGLETFFRAVVSEPLRRAMKLEILRAVVPHEEAGPDECRALFSGFLEAESRIDFLLGHCRSFVDHMRDNHAETLDVLLDETSSRYLLVLLKTFKLRAALCPEIDA